MVNVIALGMHGIVIVIDAVSESDPQAMVPNQERTQKRGKPDLQQTAAG